MLKVGGTAYSAAGAGLSVVGRKFQSADDFSLSPIVSSG